MTTRPDTFYEPIDLADERAALATDLAAALPRWRASGTTRDARATAELLGWLVAVHAEAPSDDTARVIAWAGEQITATATGEIATGVPVIDWMREICDAAAAEARCGIEATTSEERVA